MTERREEVQFSFCHRDKGFWCCAMAMNKSSLGKYRVSETKNACDSSDIQKMLIMLVGAFSVCLFLEGVISKR